MNPFYEVRKNDFTVKNNLSEVNFNSHIHSDIEILYIQKGSQHIIINNKTYEVKENEMAVIFPNILHSYFRVSKSSRAIDAILIICSKRFYRNFFPDMTDSIPLNPIIEEKSIHPDVKYAFNHIINSFHNNLKIGWIIIIMTHILSFMNLSKTKKQPIIDMSYKVISYVNEHFTEHLTLDLIAKELSVSKNYVSRIFSEKIKMNFRRYLAILRAEYAAKLIRTTDDKFTVISEISGFESLSSFNRIFHEIYGLSPREFRKNIIKKN